VSLAMPCSSLAPCVIQWFLAGQFIAASLYFMVGRYLNACVHFAQAAAAGQLGPDSQGETPLESALNTPRPVRAQMRVGVGVGVSPLLPSLVQARSCLAWCNSSEWEDVSCGMGTGGIGSAWSPKG
jgi:hypothetical protein